MLTQEQIQQALHASRVVPLPVPNSHGPLGLDHLRDAVAQIPNSPVERCDKIRRLVELSPAAWAKLDQMAADAAKSADQLVSGSQVAALILEQYTAQL
jgi:hypothetical protein